MRFTKMHGLGNDFILIEASDVRSHDPTTLARMMCDRREGVGADGLILLERSDVADVRMTIHNADGSRPRMCGNGIRCVAKFVAERNTRYGPTLRVETDSGIKTTTCDIVDGRVRSVRVDMGTPSLDARTLPTTLDLDRIVNHSVDINGTEYVLTCVSMGNPHAVIFVDDLDSIALETVGPRIERASIFPERINVHFAQVASPSHVVMRTWERGAGATWACGTGACAVCVAGVITERSSRSITATLPGGDLAIEWNRDDDHVAMTGPASEVFTGKWKA